MSAQKIDMFAMSCPVSIGTTSTGDSEIMVGIAETPWGTSVVVGVNARETCNSAALDPETARKIAGMMIAHAEQIEGGARASNGTLQ